MGNNAAKMTLEEKLVQHIKTAGLALLIDDEDAIINLTRRAIEQALLQKRTNLVGYHSRECDSPAVEEARLIAQEAAKRIKEELVLGILKNEEFKEAFKEAFIACIPQILFDCGRSIIANISYESSNTAISLLQEKIRMGEIVGQDNQPLGKNIKS